MDIYLPNICIYMYLYVYVRHENIERNHLEGNQQEGEIGKNNEGENMNKVQ